MKTKLLLIIILLVAACLPSCSWDNGLVTPAYGYADDAKDIWPAFYGVRDGGVDEGWFVAYDQNATAWQAPRMVDNNLLINQWVPQRNAVGWTTSGKYNVAFIESGNGLELWESPDDNWQDDAGAWTMTDDDTSQEWVAVDSDSYQNYTYLATLDTANSDIYAGYVNLNVGTIDFMDYDMDGNLDFAQDADDNHYSIVLPRTLFGLYNILFREAGNITHTCLGSTFNETILAIADYPQILDNGDNLWSFFTAANELFLQTAIHDPENETWVSSAAVYSATVLTSAYHASWMAADDTLWVAVVDHDPVNPNGTELRVTKRTSNNWQGSVLLLTVDSTLLGDNEGIISPTCTTDTKGNVFVYYILFDQAANGGDLQGWYLDSQLADAWDVPGNWTNYVDLDDSEDLVLWVVAPDRIPTKCEI